MARFFTDDALPFLMAFRNLGGLGYHRSYEFKINQTWSLANLEIAKLNGNTDALLSPNYAILRFGSEILLANWQRIKMTVLLRYKEV